MMTTVKGVYNGTTFDFDEDVRLSVGQEVLITLTNNIRQRTNADNSFSVFHKRTERGQRVDEYIKEIRCNDRL